VAIGTATGIAGHASGLTPRQRKEAIYGTLKTERSSFDAHWSELAEFILPRRSRFSISDKNRGERRSQSIIDSQPTFAARTLQHGLHAGLTSPARPWFKLTTPDPDLAEYQSVKEWLHLVTSRMQTIFLKSNLYQVLPTLYADLGVFGTAAMGWLEDEDTLLRGYSYPVGSYVLGLDQRLRVTTFAREFRLTVAQVVTTFGVVEGTRDIDWSRLSDVVKDAWNRSEYETPVDVLWFVAPNYAPDAQSLKASERLPWHSCYFEIGRADESYANSGGKARYLRESGFRYFPVFAPRWDVTGEDTYGTSSPGIIALGDVKQLQMMQRRKGQAIEKAINPPLKAPPTIMQTKVSLLPGGVTYVDDPTGKGLSPVHEVRMEGLEYLSADMAETRYRIDRAFYADLFLMLQQADALDTPQKTAREIEERHEEKLLALGPVLERLNDELLDPLIDRTFSTMLDAGLIPQAPPELEGSELRVEYLSVMAQAQKLTGVAGLDRFMQSAVALAEVFPDVRHKVNAMEAMDEYGSMLGVSPRVVRPDDEAEQLRQAEAQAAAAAHQAEVAKTSGQAMQAMSQAPLRNGTTALDAAMAQQPQDMPEVA
jgi:Bacteriophage head to tail connecting protein